MHAFLQHAKRSNYTTRRSCSGNLARSSRTTFGWSVVSFIFVCCLKDWISRLRMTMVFLTMDGNLYLYCYWNEKSTKLQNIRSKDDLHRLLDKTLGRNWWYRKGRSWYWKVESIINTNFRWSNLISNLIPRHSMPFINNDTNEN